jgi:hypothetical protein
MLSKSEQLDSNKTKSGPSRLEEVADIGHHQSGNNHTLSFACLDGLCPDIAHQWSDMTQLYSSNYRLRFDFAHWGSGNYKSRSASPKN